MKNLIALIALNQIYRVESSHFNIPKERPENNIMSFSIVEIVKTLKVEGDPTATIINAVNQKSFEIDDIIQGIVTGLGDKISIKIVNIETVNKTEDRLKDTKKFNIVLMKNYEDFKPIPDFYARKLLDYRGSLIVAHLSDSDKRHNDIESMLYDLWNVRIVNTNILVYGENENEVDVFTGVPYQHGNCGKINVKRLNTYKSSGFIHNCPLRSKV